MKYPLIIVLLTLFLFISYIPSMANNDSFCPVTSEKVRTCLKLEKLPKTIECLEKIAEKRQDGSDCMATAYMAKGFTYYACNFHEQAAEEFSQALQIAILTFTKSAALLFRGESYIETCRLEDALNDFNTIFEMDKKYTTMPYSNRGTLYAYLNDKEKALADFKSALEASDKASSYLHLAQIYLNKQDLDNAADFVRKTLEAYDNMTTEEIGSMQPDFSSMDFYQDLFERNVYEIPSSSDIVGIADAFYEDGLIDEALPVYLAAYYLDFSNTYVVYQIAACYEKTEYKLKAINYYNRFLCLSDDEDKNIEARDKIKLLINSKNSCRIEE